MAQHQVDDQSLGLVRWSMVWFQPPVFPGLQNERSNVYILLRGSCDGYVGKFVVFCPVPIGTPTRGRIRLLHLRQHLLKSERVGYRGFGSKRRSNNSLWVHATLPMLQMAPGDTTVGSTPSRVNFENSFLAYSRVFPCQLITLCLHFRLMPHPWPQRRPKCGEAVTNRHAWAASWRSGPPQGLCCSPSTNATSTIPVVVTV